MVKPRHLGFMLRRADRMGRAVGQQFSTGWSAELVIDDRHFTSLLAKAQHGFSEVGATGGIDPASAEDQMA
ncbi:hypothetical protein D3C77_498980 [compost metagenome]